MGNAMKAFGKGLAKVGGGVLGGLSTVLPGPLRYAAAGAAGGLNRLSERRGRRGRRAPRRHRRTRRRTRRRKVARKRRSHFLGRDLLWGRNGGNAIQELPRGTFRRGGKIKRRSKLKKRRSHREGWDDPRPSREQMIAAGNHDTGRRTKAGKRIVGKILRGAAYTSQVKYDSDGNQLNAAEREVDRRGRSRKRRR